jgi:predicted TIM-barrel fold metal-dependent hydrolase
VRIVALEEHYATPELLAATGLDLYWLPRSPRDQLVESVEARVEEMDAAGIDLQVLSAVGPGVQELSHDVAVPFARRLNDQLHDAFVATRPDRFAGFATLPTGSPKDSAAELERSVSDLGFVGALINGSTGGRFLDDPRFGALFDAAAGLGVPIYLHPGAPPPAVAAAYYATMPGHTGAMLATAGYGWHYETSLHALCLVLAGVFDRLPALKVILGHLGEGLAFHLGRIDDVLTPLAGHLGKPVSAYLRDNFWITTSGYYFDAPFRLALKAFGDDRILFAVDYPYSDNAGACAWLSHVDVEPHVREQIAHGNAEALLGL